MKAYTMQDWERDKDLNPQIGQIVADEVIAELKNCVPPAWLGCGLFQVGESYSVDKDYQNLYTTFTHEAQGWQYRGHCHLGKTEHHKSICE